MIKKILITGAAGHLGGVIYRELTKLGYKVKGSDLKIKSKSRTSGTYGPVIDKNEDFQKADLRKINHVIKITKNIPWQAGLGSASTDAASLLKGLQTLGLIKNIDN